MELSGDAAVVSGSGNRKRKRHVQQHSLEYPCVSRLRHRRLLAFLSRHDYDSTFDALVQETSVLFRVGHIQALVRQGRWADAASYVNRFVPPSRVLTDAGLVFHEFLYIHHVLDCIVAGDHLRGAQVAASYQRHVRDNPNPSHGAIKLIRILLTILHCHPIRAFLNWHLVRYKAAEIIKDLIPQIPEFNDLLKLPKGCPLLLSVRRDITQDYHVMQQTGLQISSVILVCLVSPAFVDFPLSLDFRTFSDKSLQAGVLRDGYPFKHSCNEAIQISKRIELSSLATLGGYLLSFLIPENIAGVTGAPIGLDSPANSYGISTQTIADMMRPLIISDIGQGSVARNNPTRPETTAHQAISPTTQQITTEFVQHSESQFQEYNSQMDGRVRIVESGMKRSRSFGGGCSSSVEISS
ncbi:hypothetical protein OsI_17418 [Oryza sativa Indica Group]|uniref:Uncharacterized protein n=1 Tax=Oryza sativa subsp. indica TaxID=39946 RepID=B8AUI4_ORYSI|nr:hypothetical protein OsI_17418 [Oryza sativa Indica Group]